MNKCLVALWLLFFPLLAMADSTSLSLTPPPSDYSVMFLGNLFGIVDGVLHGTGSQIMGAIFTVFNAAVLALGGIVIMYTLIVGTMNTAHEGEMLGHKWSSIWIPIRSTAGLALLIPKASGYCLMQIFVMWVIVQGVGAADKVWAAALAYLNQGGVIIQASGNPSYALSKTGASPINEIAQGASSILASEVCMLGLQKLLELKRSAYLASTSVPGSPCASSTASSGTPPNATMAGFCGAVVPDLLSTVDAPGYQSSNPLASGAYSMPVPYFGTNQSSPYAILQGICGTISWNVLAPPAVPNGTSNTTNNVNYQATASQTSSTEMMSLSRATAVQQMYVDYQAVAQAMISNDPRFQSFSDVTTSGTAPTLACPPQATNVFGVPYSVSTATPCAANSTDCTLWQGGYNCPDSTAGSTTVGVPILNGTELQNGIADYTGVMMPTLNLMAQISEGVNINKSRAFIANANAQGWLSAGSYFFDLVTLNGSASPSSNSVDTNSGLGSSSPPNRSSLKSTFADTPCAGTYANLCAWITGSATPSPDALKKGALYIERIHTLLGDPPGNSATAYAAGAAVTGNAASTTYGYVKNALTLQLPGQPPMAAPKIDISLFPTVENTTTNFNFPSPACGRVPLLGCLGKAMMTIIYDSMAAFSQIFTNVLAVWVNQMILLVIAAPIGALEYTFTTGVQYLTQHPGDNPIVVLAEMGVYYINAPANVLVSMFLQILASAFIPPFGPLIFGVLIIALGLAAPLIASWMGVMLSVGFVTAFYVPFLPYMIFTFGVIGWLTAVIEAMAAAPIVALAITHPEGEGILGSKGEHGLMILMNVFLRPSMMIIGYISAIALCYVSVWIINTGFSHVLSFIQNGSVYTGWAGLYVTFFSVVIYTSMYVTVAQKAFNLIYMLPDHVLKWIGGQPENVGQEAASWAQETQKQVEKGGEASDKGQSGAVEKVVGAAEAVGTKGKGGKTDLSVS